MNLPALGVWHEPFDTKPVGWQWYYNIRNKFLLCAMRGMTGRKTYAKYLLANLFTCLLAHDYYSAWLICEAAEDYLDGPKIVESLPQEKHSKLLAAQNIR